MVKDINIKHRSYYFFLMTWLISKILIENIKLEKKNYKHIDIKVDTDDDLP